MNNQRRDPISFPTEEYHKEIPVHLPPKVKTTFVFIPEQSLSIDCVEWTNHEHVSLERFMIGNRVYYEKGLFCFTRMLVDPGWNVSAVLYNSCDTFLDTVVIVHGRTIDLEPLNELREQVREFLGRMSTI